MQDLRLKLTRRTSPVSLSPSRYVGPAHKARKFFGVNKTVDVDYCPSVSLCFVPLSEQSSSRRRPLNPGTNVPVDATVASDILEYSSRTLAMNREWEHLSFLTANCLIKFPCQGPASVLISMVVSVAHLCIHALHSVVMRWLNDGRAKASAFCICHD